MITIRRTHDIFAKLQKKVVKFIEAIPVVEIIDEQIF